MLGKLILSFSMSLFMTTPSQAGIGNWFKRVVLAEPCEKLAVERDALAQVYVGALDPKQLPKSVRFEIGRKGNSFSFISPATGQREKISVEGDSKFISFSRPEVKHRESARVVDLYQKPDGLLYVRIEEIRESQKVFSFLTPAELLTARVSPNAKSNFLTFLSPIERQVFKLFDGRDFRFWRTEVHSEQKTQVVNELAAKYDRMRPGDGGFAQYREREVNKELLDSLNEGVRYIWVITGSGRLRLAPEGNGTGKHIALAEGCTVFAAGELIMRNGIAYLDLESGSFMKDIVKGEKVEPNAHIELVRQAFELLTGVSPFVKEYK